MMSIIKRFVIEEIELRLPSGNVKLVERQVNNMVGYIVTTRYLDQGAAEIRFHDANGRVVEAMALESGPHERSFQRPVSMYLNDISITYSDPDSISPYIEAEISLLGEKKIDISQ